MTRPGCETSEMRNFSKTVLRTASAAGLSAALLAGCASQDADDGDVYAARSAQEIYQIAEGKLSEGKAQDAADTFNEVERLFPYSNWAKRAMMMAAFSYHQAGSYDDSRAAAQRYLDFFPADKDAAYAQFLVSLSFYDRITDVGRDQGNTFEALQQLRTVIERYPNSEFAESARLKFDLTLSHLAGQEMEIGRFYLKRDHFSAAINRFRAVVEDYQTTAHTAEALHRLVESYLSLGLTDEARTAAAILGYNFKGTEWYDASFQLLTSQGLEPGEAGDGWLTRIYRQVIKGQWI